LPFEEISAEEEKVGEKGRPSACARGERAAFFFSAERGEGGLEGNPFPFYVGGKREGRGGGLLFGKKETSKTGREETRGKGGNSPPSVEREEFLNSPERGGGEKSREKGGAVLSMGEEVWSLLQIGGEGGRGWRRLFY